MFDDFTDFDLKGNPPSMGEGTAITDNGTVGASIEFTEVPMPDRPVIGTAGKGAAADLSARAIAGFFQKVIEGAGEPVVAGVRGALGLGKTAAVIEQLVNPALADKFINFYAPEHRLNGELLERFNATAGPGAPRARVVLGRRQQMPDGTPMCQYADLALQVQALGRSVQDHLCRAVKDDGTEEKCDHFDTCPYQAQRLDKEPGIRLMAHAHLFIPKSDKDEEKLPVDAVVIDESFWQASLRGTDGAGVFVPTWRLRSAREVPLRDKRRTTRDNSMLLSPGATADLADFSAKCFAAIEAGGTLEGFKVAGITAGTAKYAMGLEHSRADMKPFPIHPGMKRQWKEMAIANYSAPDALKFARLFRLLSETLAADVEPKFLYLRNGVKNKDDLPEDRIYLHWSADVNVGNVHALMIDADLEPEIVRRFFPRMGEPVVANARLNNYWAVQITDTAVPKSRLVPDPSQGVAENSRRANRRSEVRSLLEVEAASGKTLLVTYKGAEEAIAAEGDIPNAHYAHWNALRGHDEWRDVRSLIIAGVPQPGVESVERMASALWYLDPVPVESAKGYETVLRGIAMADGTTQFVEVKAHPDSRCTLLLDQVRAEAMQAIGRARLVHRGVDNPCRVFILTSYPLSLEVHKLSTWDDVMPNPVEVMAARGIVLQRLRDIAEVMPELVDSKQDDPRSTVSKALKAVGVDLSELFTEPYSILKGNVNSSTFTQFRYRVQGERKAALAWIDEAKHPDPKEALEEVLGELSLFERTDGTPLTPTGKIMSSCQGLKEAV